jgi:hypothetical protein
VFVFGDSQRSGRNVKWVIFFFGGHGMSRALTNSFAVALAAGVLSAAVARADFVENFDSYPAGQALPSPWVSTTDMFIGGNGYSSPNTAFGPAFNYVWGSAFHDTAVAGTETSLELSWRVYASSATDNYSQVGLFTSTSIDSTHSPNSDNVQFQTYHLGGQTRAMLVATDFEGGSYVADHRVDGASYAKDQWIDLRLVLSGSSGVQTALGYTRVTGSPTWDLLGSVTTYAGFSASHVGIGAIRDIYIDDVAFSSTPVPEPAGLGVLVLLGSGVCSRRRRQAKAQVGK